MGKNEEITNEVDVIETQEEETEMVEKKSFGTKAKEVAGKVANSKVCRTIGKGIILVGAAAGGFVLGKHLNGKSEEEADDYYDVDASSDDSSAE